ncbi:MAG TPA: response regulator [Candidatus Eisenbacteria bacterium]|jgi:PAS domain S-box-containing protein|nr:response regulator [Candidatus Eisenbacteria bacterium]
MNWDGKVKILMVDDQPAKLLTYEAILADLGEHLIKAKSAREALEWLLREEIGVVLTDVSMPDLDGFELARMIRDHPRYRRTSIIFCSAIHMSDQDRLMGYQCGAVDYVSVPVVPEILRAKVSVFADLYRKTRQLESVNAELEQRVTILQSTSAIVYVIDAQGRFGHVNRRFEQVFGTTLDEVRGKTAFDLFPREVAEAFEVNNRQVLTENRSIEFEETVLAQSGTRHYASIKAPIRNAAGAPQGIVAVATDITERKRLEEALKDADRRKDEFLAVLAHELRNPLAPIRNVLQILRVKAPEDAELLWARDVIGRQVDQLTRLVDDLLDVSRISRGKIKLQLSPLDLATVIAGAVETSRPLIDARLHRLTLQLPEKPIWVQGDLVRLTQVVANLLNNAAKYQDAGGYIGVTVAREDNDAVISVKDKGVGIAPELLPGVFDMFEQVQRPLGTSQDGLGIGLSLARSLVELHGGTIAAKSGGGDGSEFTVRMPCMAGEPRKKRAAPSGVPPAIAASGLRVLVVDDNEDAAESLATLLQQAGHQVSVAHEGSTALALAERERPRVVFLDIGLPGMDGYEICKAMRQGGHEDALIVALTGYGQEEDRARTRAAGFDGHLVKPGDPNELIRLITTSAKGSAKT